MSKENRAFDTHGLGATYGFESHPRLPVELPPTWVLAVGLGFLMFALGFWVWKDAYT
jgi:dolichyl-phosphate beta-glucosyltransferase